LSDVAPSCFSCSPFALPWGIPSQSHLRLLKTVRFFPPTTSGTRPSTICRSIRIRHLTLTRSDRTQAFTLTSVQGPGKAVPLEFLTMWYRAVSRKLISSLITRTRATRVLILSPRILKSRGDPTRPGIVTFSWWTGTSAFSMKRGPRILSLAEAGKQGLERSLIFDRTRFAQAGGLLRMRQDFLCCRVWCVMMRWLRVKFIMPSGSRSREREKPMSGLRAIMLQASRRSITRPWVSDSA